MTFNLFGRVVIGSLWEATAQRLNKEYQRENSVGENNNYVDGVNFKGHQFDSSDWFGNAYGQERRGN